MGKNVLKSLKKFLGMGVLAGGLMLSNEAKGFQDYISINNRLKEERGHELGIGHYYKASEGYDSYDLDYLFPAPWAGQWVPRITTQVDGHELEGDLRPTNSVSKFEADLSAIIQDGNDIIGTNRLGVKAYDTTIYDGFDTNRHYIGEYWVYSNYTENGKEFLEKKNLRDLCPVVNTYYSWDGPNVGLLASETNEQGEIDFGKFIQSCDWNRLVSTKTGSGTNSFEGNQVLPYNTNLIVTLAANVGSYVDYYVLTRTDNTGAVSIVTNDISGTTTTSTNVPLAGIKGSNSIHAEYAPLTYNLTVTSAPGNRGNPSPGTVSNRPHGSVSTQTIDTVVDPGVGTRYLLKAPYFDLNGTTTTP